jgi:hypothetical protein
VDGIGEQMVENQPGSELPRLSRRWFLGKPVLPLIVALVALALALCAITLQIVQVRKLEARVQELEWSDRVEGEDAYFDTVEPSVGTIQFLRHGYSVEFTKVNYTPVGLVLSGFIGNPSQIWISTLTLEFTASRPRSALRTEYFRKRYRGRFFFLPEQSIGTAQAETIDILPPGQRQPFHVTIPNVKQTREGFQLTVAFSGERYTYGL